jgi:hypothetical protein
MEPIAPRVRELKPPGAVGGARAQADEILRLWIVDRAELAATFPADLYGDDVWKWGRVLANLARYIAKADADRRGVSEAEVLEALRLNFDEEVKAGGAAQGAVRAMRSE